MYYFNVCGDANQVPAACVSLEKAVQAPAYQVTSTDDCFWLGKLRSSEWELVDESEPAAGASQRLPPPRRAPPPRAWQRAADCR